MNLNNLMAQASKMQKEITKKQEEFYANEFTFDYKNGAILITIFGNCEIKKISINKSLIDPEDSITLEEMIAEAINSAYRQIKSKLDEITSSLMPSGSGNLF